MHDTRPLIAAHTAWAGKETAHLYPFHAKLLRGCRLAELTSVDDFKTAFERWPALSGMRQAGFLVSADKLVRIAFIFLLYYI